MKEYGFYYESSKVEEWKGHYIDYESLKEQISILERGEDVATGTSRTHYPQVRYDFVKESNEDTDIFVHALKQEIEKAALFYQTLDKSSLEAISFGMANRITVRQLLLRYEAFVRTVFKVYPVTEEDLLFHTSLSLLDPSLDSVPQYQMMQDLSSVQQCNKLLLLLQSLSEPHHASLLDSLLITLRPHVVTLQRRGVPVNPNLFHVEGYQKDMKALAHWKEATRNPNRLDPENVWPLLLNLVSCFLFIMNNYIIEPSSAYYASALGKSEALSGIMIGAAPWFALVSAVAYSIWTNRCYKSPILFAAILMLVGNTMYACAYSYKSITLCLLGRSICGLGAPRVINRRYVADATPFALRTPANAAFSLMTALGAALSPGVAIGLDSMTEFEFTLPFLGTQYFNGMTGPGYFMAVCWMIYAILIVFTFQEPTRSGLEELIQREKPSKSGDSDYVPADDEISPQSVQRQTKSPSKSSPCSCLRHMTLPMSICMALIFMKRIALESIMASTSVVTKNRYGWTIKNVATLHFVNGIVVIPVSICTGWLSQFYEDRYLALWCMSIALIGMLVLVDTTDFINHDNNTFNDDSMWAVGPVRYVTGSLAAFSGVEACESFVAALLSKVVPSALAAGTFNSGLLLTLVGTLGRAVGDSFITAMGFVSIRNLLNLLIVPSIFLTSISIFLVRRFYGLLAI